MNRINFIIVSIFFVTNAQAWNAPSLSSPNNNASNLNTGVYVDWYAVSNSEGYIVELDTISSFDSPLFQTHTDLYINSSSSNNDTEEFFQDLLFGQQYYWRVKAFVTNDTSSWTSRQFSTRSTVSLSSPSNNSTTQQTGVYLDWYSSWYVNSYQVELDTSINFNSSLLQTHQDTYINSSSSNTDTDEFFQDLYFGQKYYWRVRAINDNDTSDWSLRNFTTKNNLALNSPSNASTTQQISVSLNWNSMYYVDAYQVEIDTSANFDSPLYQNHQDAYINTSSSNTDTDEFFQGLYFGQKYYWRVRAINSVDTTAWAQRYFTTKNSLSLNSPSNGSTSQQSSVSLNWNSLYYVNSYEVELDTSANFDSPLYQYHQDTYINTSSSNTDTDEFFQGLYFGQKYYWRVRAITSIDTTLWTQRYFTTKNSLSLNSPSNGSTTQQTGVSLNWNSMYYVNSYEVELDTSANFNSSLYQYHQDTYINTSSSNTDTDEFFQGLLYGQKYYWRVRAITAIDTTLWTQRYFTTKDYLTLNSPSNNAVNQQSGISLNWNSMYYIDSYQLELDTASAYNSPLLQTLQEAYINTSSSNTDTDEFYQNLRFGTTYNWRVRAISPVDTSLWAERNFTTRDYVTVTSPSNLALNQATSGVNFNWNALYYISSYEIEWDTTSLFNSPILQSLNKAYINTSSSNSDTYQSSGPLLNNQTYFWRVRGINLSDTTNWIERIFSTGSSIQNLSVPQLISPSDNSIGVSLSPTLDWMSVSNATSYELQYSTVSNFSTFQTITTPTNVTSIMGLTSNTIYYWRVKAINAQDNSNWSTVWSFTTDVSACVDADEPILQATSLSICNGDNSIITIQTGNLNDATAWGLYTVSCSGTQEALLQSGSFTVSPTVTTQYFVIGEGGCVVNSTCGTITIVVNEPYNSIENTIVCKGDDYTFPDGTTVTNMLNDMSYVSTLQSVESCDSVITTNITVPSINTFTTTQGITISANETNALYQWIDCSDNSIIVGETNQTFTPTLNGEYAVILTSNNCSETSNCVLINSVGLSTQNELTLNIYPNPSNGLFKISGYTNGMTIKISDIDGKTVNFELVGNEVNISSLANGIYFMEISDDNRYVRKKIIKQ